MSQGHAHGPANGQVVEQQQQPKRPETLEEWRDYAGQLEAELDQSRSLYEVLQEKYANLDQDQTIRIASIRARDKHAARLTGIIDQMGAENRVLRKRVGLGETEPIEVDDVADADVLGDAEVIDLPEAAETQVPEPPGQDREYPIDEAKTLGQEQPVTGEPAPEVADDDRAPDG